MKCTVRFEPAGLDIEVEPGRTLLEAARGAQVAIPAVCGGRGGCGKCQVRVLRGPLPPPTHKEIAALPEEALGQGWRLACEYSVTADATIQSIAVRHQGKGEAPPFDASFSPDPPLHHRRVELSGPSLDRPVDDAGNLGAALGGSGGILSMDLELLRELPELLRSAEWRVAASIRHGELIALRPQAEARPALGCAVDLGTTNLALYLHRLEDGELLGVYAAANPLASYGADIVTRLGHGEKSSGAQKEMQSVLVKAVNLLAGQAAADQACGSQDIEEMAVVGNSGMHHLFLGLPGKRLIRAPYVPVLKAAMTIKARELGLAMAPGGYVYMPPLVGGFVGSDLLAVALSSRMDTSTGIRLAVDIGTNTEVILSVDGELHCCSTASGPALEGAALRFGTVASPGAIDRVWVSAENGELAYSTLGGIPASGICGSGIIDALRALRALGLVSRTGRLDPDPTRVIEDEGGERLCRLAPKDATSLGLELVISQTEIRSILLAKGAIRAGIDSLLALQGIGPGEVDEFLIAGAFGTHLDIASAVDIGLFPPLPFERFRQIGNAAGTGAGLMLLSEKERRRAERLAASIRHVELSLQEGFRLRFAKAQWFPEEIP
jgi:uncharacterized 2Fe-2S/4Fe-4S cluster protein (DUF4445 family)